MKKLWKKKVRKQIKKGLEKIGAFFKVLWRDREYIAVKAMWLAFFALSIKEWDEVAAQSAESNMAGMCISALAGLVCLIPAEHLLIKDEKKKGDRKKDV